MEGSVSCRFEVGLVGLGNFQEFSFAKRTDITHYRGWSSSGLSRGGGGGSERVVSVCGQCILIISDPL